MAHYIVTLRRRNGTVSSQSRGTFNGAYSLALAYGYKVLLDAQIHNTEHALAFKLAAAELQKDRMAEGALRTLAITGTAYVVAVQRAKPDGTVTRKAPRKAPHDPKPVPGHGYTGTMRIDQLEAFKRSWPCHGLPDSLHRVQAEFGSNGDLVDVTAYARNGRRISIDMSGDNAMLAVVEDIQHAVNPDHWSARYDR